MNRMINITYEILKYLFEGFHLPLYNTIRDKYDKI